MQQLAKAIDVTTKWGRARAAIYGLYKHETDGENKYCAAMAQRQHIIKGYAAKQQMDTIPALLAICNDEMLSAMDIVNYLAAGYDLLNGLDYTTEKAPLGDGV